MSTIIGQPLYALAEDTAGMARHWWGKSFVMTLGGIQTETRQTTIVTILTVKERAKRQESARRSVSENQLWRSLWLFKMGDNKLAELESRVGITYALDNITSKFNKLVRNFWRIVIWKVENWIYETETRNYAVISVMNIHYCFDLTIVWPWGIPYRRTLMTLRAHFLNGLVHVECTEEAMNDKFELMWRRMIKLYMQRRQQAMQDLAGYVDAGGRQWRCRADIFPVVINFPIDVSAHAR